jgi:chemotaxis protein MotB
MGTFADLMSLLMCFFVLLLSFSEMDVIKFKQIAGSMKFAFGVQNKLELKDIPKGTSVIAMEFSPGKPQPTPIETIQQVTTEVTLQELEFQDGEDAFAGGEQRQEGHQSGGQAQADSVNMAAASESVEIKAQAEQLQKNAKKIAEKMQQQIEDGALDFESQGQQIVITIKEQGSFPAGSAFLQPQFKPIIAKLAEVIADIPGEVEVAGHSDISKVSNKLYSSNWDISASRAVAVAEVLVQEPAFDSSRLVVVGKGSNELLTTVPTVAEQAKNRRVEIRINQGKPKFLDPISVSNAN